MGTLFHDERLEGAHPDLARAVRAIAAALPFDIGIPLYGGGRTDADQTELYSLGRDAPEEIVARHQGSGVPAPGNVVTYAKDTSQTAHGVKDDGLFYGCDLAPYNTTTKDFVWDNLQQQQAIGAAAKAQGLTWGGDWSKPKTDRPHVELPDWQTLAAKAEEEIADLGEAVLESAKGHALLWVLGAVVIIGGAVGFAIWRAHA